MDNTFTISNLSYSFDNDGNVQNVRTSFVGNMPDGSYINANIQISSTDLPSGKTFDDLTKNDFEAIGRTKLSNLTKYPADATTQPASAPDTASTPAK